MTEDEAKTKWCPHARVVLGIKHNDSYSGGCNKLERADLSPPNNVAIPNGAKCIASECMDWRTTADRPVSIINTSGKPDDGYCGLAGKP